MSEETKTTWSKPAEGRYANYFQMGFNSEEVVLDLGQLYGTDGSIIFHTRIVTSPVYANELAGLLSTTLRDYEASHGSLRPAEAAVDATHTESKPDPAGAEAVATPATHPTGLSLSDPVPAGESMMVGQAVTAMLQKLQVFLPSALTPPSTVSVASVEEHSVGLGQWRGQDIQDTVPIALKGVRLHAVVRFELWDSQAPAVESAVATLIDLVLAAKETLRTDGFLDLKLKNASLAENIDATTWRISVEFEVVFEFHFQDTDGAGGLIARIPAEFRDTFGSATVTGDLVVWNEDGAATLRLSGGKAVRGISTLTFLPGSVPLDAVTILRTYQGAFGAPVPFGTLTDFLAAVSGPAPAQRHAEVQFSSLSGFLSAIGPESDPVSFLDELGVPREFRPRTLAFSAPIQLGSKSDRLEVTFTGPALGASQILYLRASRGLTNPS